MKELKSGPRVAPWKNSKRFFVFPMCLSQALSHISRQFLVVYLYSETNLEKRKRGREMPQSGHFLFARYYAKLFICIRDTLLVQLCQDCIISPNLQIKKSQMVKQLGITYFVRLSLEQNLNLSVVRHWVLHTASCNSLTKLIKISLLIK